MANPIKETPVLRGKDAVNFYKRMEEASKVLLPKSEVIRMQKNYEKLAKIIK